MTFWFCQNCKKVWHSHIQTLDSVKKIRCFYCMKNASVRLREDRLIDEKFQYRDYDKNTREFLKVKRRELANNNKAKKAGVARPLSFLKRKAPGFKENSGKYYGLAVSEKKRY